MDLQLAHNFTSWGQLKGAATFVVVGTAGQQGSSTDRNGFPWTTTTVHVDRIVADPGGLVAQDVTVRQMGSATLTIENFPLLQPGSRYLLFLTPTVVTTDQYYPIGAYQGVFTVAPDDTVRSLTSGPGTGGLQMQGSSLDRVIAEIQAAPPEDVSP